MTSHDALIAEIAAAFDGVSRGGGISLHEAEALDCHAYAEERVAARLIDVDRCWQDVPDAWLEEFSSVPYFLDPIGFRYYLPAYMVWALRHAPGSDSATEDNIVWQLLEERRVSELLPLLSERQKDVTRRWLEAVESRYPVRSQEEARAIREIWGNPRESRRDCNA